MLKKIMVLAAALAALIAVAAPAAQAELTLTNEAEEHVPLNTPITAVSEDTHTTTGAGVLSCAVVGITGKLTENGAHITVEADGVNPSATATGCTANGVLPAHITAKVDKITLETGGVGHAYGVTFVSQVTAPPPPLGPGTFSCHFVNSGETLPLAWSETGVDIPSGEPTNLTGTAPCGNGNITSEETFHLYREAGGKHVEELHIVED